MSEPDWIDAERTIKIHNDVIKKGPGAYGIRDQGLLDSALDRPKNRYLYGSSRIDHADLAGNYAFGLVKNHPFVDGNKRTAFVVFSNYLAKNVGLYLTNKVENVRYTIKLAEGEISEEDFSKWIRVSLLKSISVEKLKLD